MNASTPPLLLSAEPPPSTDDIRQALQQILVSGTFARAPRMCRLLAFLVGKKLSGAERDINEYAIGLEVFGRDARTYSTGEDPLVRVQVGRLRERLNAYYRTGAVTNAVRISIPVGNYVPLVEHAALAAPAERRRQMLAMAPLQAIGGGADGEPFARGVNEELSAQLYATLGGRMLRPEAPGNVSGEPAAHRLEGSIRVEQGHVRASVRLIDGNAGHIAWLHQFDRHGELGIRLQEELAAAISTGLSGYLLQLRR